MLLIDPALTAGIFQVKEKCGLSPNHLPKVIEENEYKQIRIPSMWDVL